MQTQNDFSLIVILVLAFAHIHTRALTYTSAMVSGYLT